MEKRELQIDLKLDQKLSKFCSGHIDLRFQFMQWATIEQKKDLLAFIIYWIANGSDEPYSLGNFRIIRANIIHDMKGILRNDPHFLPKSYGYDKIISITKL